MSEEHALVIVAGYQDLDSARRDFDTLTERTKDKQVSLRGAVLVGKDAEGNPVLVDTGNRLGRRGAAWGAGAGLAVGLFSPALLASAAVGAAAGALAGTFANHRIKSGLGDKIGQALAAGSGVVIAVVPAEGRLATEQALAGSPMKSVAELSSSTLRSLGAALEEAMGKFDPDRTRLPLPQRGFGGTIGRTMAESVGDWTIVPGPKAPDAAPNVLIVLIDDAGFGGPDTFGGAIRTPTLTRVAQNGLTYNRFHVTAVCSPTRAALLTGRNHHRVGFGSVCRIPGSLPGLLVGQAAELRLAAAYPARQRLCHRGIRQVALDPGQRPGGGGAVRQLAAGVGLRPLLGVPVRGRGPVRPHHHPGQLRDRGAAGQGRQALLLPRRPHRQGRRVAAQRAGPGRREAVDDVLLDRRHPRPAPRVRRMGRQVPGPVRRGLGCLPAQNLRTAKATRRSFPPDAELTERPDLFPAWDSLSDNQKKLYARQMEVFAGFSENADWNVGRLLDAIDDLGETDNTLVFYIWGDNGASMEGTITGSFNEMTFLNGVVLDADHQLELIEQYGGIEAIGNESHRAAFRLRVGARQQHPVPVGQADGQPPRRCPRSDGGRLADPDPARRTGA